MSGPKNSGYSVSAEQLRRLAEQQRLERERREEEKRVEAETSAFHANKARIASLVSEIEKILAGKILPIEKKLGKFTGINGETLKKLEKAQKKETEIGSPQGKNSKSLSSNNAELKTVIAELAALRNQCEEISANLHKEYYRKQNATIKEGYVTTTDPEKLAKVEELKAFEREEENLRKALSEFSPDDLPGDYLQAFERLKEEASKVKISTELRKFISSQADPFIRESKLYRLRIADFSALYVTYSALAEVYETEIEDFEKYKENSESLKQGIALLKQRIAELEQRDLEERQLIYIYDSLSEAMEELGYSLWGDCDVEKKKSGKTVHHQLYRFSEDTAIDVYYEYDGQITMEIGKADNCDRAPTKTEATQMVAQMESFCDAYSKLEDILRSKGVESTRLCASPPDADYAQIINVTEFGGVVEQPKKAKRKSAKEDVKKKRKEREKKQKKIQYLG